MQDGLRIAEGAPAGGEARSPESFESFYLGRYEAVCSAIWLVTRDRQETEEIVQEAFLKIWERWERVRDLEDPAGYLYRTAMNVWRSRGRRAAVAIRRTVRAVPPPDAMDEVDARDAVIRALAPLTPRQRAALVLTELLGLNSEEAGRALGVRPSTIRVLAARARTRLQEGMEP
jgi:RNA polymerase sigma-70 factor (ECF subfamily)